MNRSVTGFGRNVQKSFSGIGGAASRMRGLLTGAVAILTTGAIARGVSDFAKAGDEIAKTSRAIGMSAEALQELRFAADRSGVSNETFTKSLEKLNKNVGDLRAGTGMLTTLLNKSNPALAEQLKQAESNEQAFTLLTEALAKMENPMDRASLAQAAFGRSGQELLVMVENGAEGIEALRQEARKYGNIISGDAAEGCERFVDAMTNMRSSMNAVKNDALAPLIEEFTPLIQKMADWAAANRDVINQKIQAVMDTITKAGRILTQQWKNGTIPAILGAVVAFKSVSLALTGVGGLVTAIGAVKKVLAGGGIASLLSGGPIVLIAAAIAAAAFLVIKNWDKVSAFFKGFWKGMKAGFQNLYNFIKPIIDVITGVWDKVKGVFEGGGRQSITGGMVSANQGMIESRSYSENRSTVDVNLNNMPQGSTVRQRGRAPGVNLNYGYMGGRM